VYVYVSVCVLVCLSDFLSARDE